jgi:hypothetical protein
MGDNIICAVPLNKEIVYKEDRVLDKLKCHLEDGRSISIRDLWCSTATLHSVLSLKKTISIVPAVIKRRLQEFMLCFVHLV